ncbi:MAG: hypothetical protein JNN12_17385 [Bacteroidetes Order II. Incertae sedis bacterium]|nr:hypothetical protein [Bacteroidetes Order II. bacterium]
MAKKQRFINRVLRWLHYHEWWLLGGMAVVAFILGLVGYWQYYRLNPSEIGWTWWDIFYKVGRFFVIEGDEPMGPSVPLVLQISRFMAPIPPVFAAAKAIFSVFQNEIRAMQAHFYKDHVVFLGLGSQGSQLAREFLEDGKKVIFVKTALSEEEDGWLWKLGGIGIEGDPQDRYVLQKVRAQWAKHIVLLDDDDQINLANAVLLRKYINEPSFQQMEPVRVFIHLYNDRLGHIFRRHPIFTDTQDRFEGSLFNIYEASARTLLQVQPPEKMVFEAQRFDINWSSCQPVHILLIGLGQMGRNLLYQLILTGHYPHQEKLYITIVDFKATEKVAVLSSLYPELMQIVSLRPLDVDVTVLNESTLKQLQGNPAYTVVYLCLGTDTLGAEVALSLRQRLVGLSPQTPIVTVFPHEVVVSNVLSECSVFQKKDRMFIFPAVENGCTMEMVVQQSLDELARMIHASYLEEAKRDGYYNPESPSHQPWTALQEDFRDANRHQADHIRVKLATLGCVMQPEGGPLEKVDWVGLLQENPDWLLALAQTEHRRWMASRWLLGWRFAEKTNRELLLHENLVHWDDLSEHVKSLDADTVKNIPALLAKIGLEVCKMPAL